MVAIVKRMDRIKELLATILGASNIDTTHSNCHSHKLLRLAILNGNLTDFHLKTEIEGYTFHNVTAVLIIEIRLQVIKESGRGASPGFDPAAAVTCTYLASISLA